MPSRPFTRFTKRLTIVGAVIGLHVAGLWAMQSGLLSRVVEMVVPVQVIAEMIEAPQPVIPPAPPPPPAPKPEPVVQKPRPVVKPAPRPEPVPIAEPPPQVAETATITAPPPPPPVAQAPAPAPAAQTEAVQPPAPPRIELPSSDADYLNNPRPAYPALSRRLGEQGKVVVRVFIDTDGSAKRAEVRTSSGYERLDQTALQTVQRWRYVPGKRNGLPEAMWFNVPINFVLE